MKQKIFLSLLLIGIFFLKMEAQDIKNEAYKNNVENTSLTDYKTVLKYYPTGLINPNGSTFQFGIQQQLSNKFHIEFSAGYATSFGGRWVIPVPLSGFSVRTEGMFAVYKTSRSGVFLGGQLIYKYIKENPTEEFVRFGNAYNQFIEYNSTIEQFTANFLFLYQRKIGKRLLFELGAGQGIGVSNREDIGIPEDAVSLDEQNILFNFDEPGRSNYPSFHFRLGVGVNISGK